MGTRVRAAFASLAVAALALTGVTACSPEPDKPGTVRVIEGQPATLAVDGVTVDIPGKAIDGSGTLSVTEGERDGHTGWEIALTDGATLVGEATLTFKGQPQADEPLPIVMYAAADGAFHPAETVEAAKGGAKVTTGHFSFWMVTWWNTLIEPVKAAWAAVFSDLASDAAVSCSDSAALEASDYVTDGPDESDERASWCAGMSGGKPELQVKNTRSYPSFIESTSGLVLQDPDNSIESLIAQLFTILGVGPTEPGNSLYPLFAGELARYQVANDSLQGLRVSANPSAYVAQVLRFAVDTSVLVAGAVGKSVSAKTITTAMEATNCVDGFGKIAGANPASANAVADYLKVAVDASFACVGSTMAKLYTGGALAALVVGGLSWIFNGAQLVGSAAQAIGDMVTNIGNDYIVSISKNTRWLITSEGIGPAQFADSTETAEAALGDAALDCRGESGPWVVTIWGDGMRSAYMYMLALNPADVDSITDAPVTQSGVTIGTPESELVALGYTLETSKIGVDFPEYTWEEDGVPFVAGVEDGVVYGLGVGTTEMQIEYCS
jgi:hypothetical protein